MTLEHKLPKELFSVHIQPKAEVVSVPLHQEYCPNGTAVPIVTAEPIEAVKPVEPTLTMKSVDEAAPVVNSAESAVLPHPTINGCMV